MPELPEVECVRRTLMPQVVGRRVSRARVFLAKLARPDAAAFGRGIAGRLVTGCRRQGKLLILELEGGAFWTIHLGMTGQLILAAQMPQATHIHIAISFTDKGPCLYFRDLRQFGAMTYCPDQKALASGPLANMGPDALSLAAGVFVKRLAGRKAPLKSLLLDQRILAGVGNIYADEALHRAGLSPLSRPCDLSSTQLTLLHGELIKTLNEALAQGGSSVRNFVDAKGRPGTFQHAHRVYRRTGQPCPVCGGDICKITLGGRSTHFCPACQK